MIPSSGCPPWPPDHPRTLPRTGNPTPPPGARPPLLAFVLIRAGEPEGVCDLVGQDGVEGIRSGAAQELEVACLFAGVADLDHGGRLAGFWHCSGLGEHLCRARLERCDKRFRNRPKGRAHDGRHEGIAELVINLKADLGRAVTGWCE